jgi:hypothetical protein
MYMLSPSLTVSNIGSAASTSEGSSSATSATSWLMSMRADTRSPSTSPVMEPMGIRPAAPPAPIVMVAS